jgi:hypothetical protein
VACRRTGFKLECIRRPLTDHQIYLTFSILGITIYERYTEHWTPKGERYCGIGFHLLHIEVVKADIAKKKLLQEFP